MGKRSRSKARDQQPAGTGGPDEVGPRQPCPCGSGKRYKACHGDPDAVPAFVARPFEGLDSECDVVAMRELVPAATAPLPLLEEYAAPEGRQVRLCTLLPGAAPGLVRDSGEVWLGLQVQHGFGDPARDLAAVLLRALEAEPGAVGLTAAPGPGPRLQDVVAPGPLEITVHDGFDYWVADVAEQDPAMAAALEQANAGVIPTTRLRSVEAAYWASVGTKEHLRWVMPEPEDRLLDALARLHTDGRDSVAEGSRLVGMFRAHGLLAPVWDLPVGTGAAVLEEPAARFRADLDAALGEDRPLTPEERSARAGLANRQVTIR